MISILSLLTGLMAGIYFAFSIVVIKALDLMPNTDGARAMNSINDVILRTVFMPLFFISSLWYASLLIWNVFLSDVSQPYVVWASLFYLVGMFGVTAFCNVPLNNQLKLSADNSDRLAEIWKIYRHRWLVFNHIRLASCVIAFLLLNYGV